MRIGILGAAKISPPAVLVPAADTSGVEITVIASRDLARARAQAEAHGVPHVVGDYAELLARDDVDAVYNPLPISLHHRWALNALDAGKHVLQEKPFASNADQAAEIVTRADERGLVVMEAFHWRFHPLAERITELASTSVLGPLRRVEAVFDVEIDPSDDVRHSWELSGGALMDLGCYAVQWVRHVVGREPTVTAATMREGRPDVDVDTRVHLDFGGGVTGHISTSMAPGVPRRSSIRAVGEAGVLTVDGPLDPHNGNRVTLTRHGEDTPETDEEVSGRTTYHHQLEAFRDAVTAGMPVPTGGTDAVATMRVIDAAYRAAGLPVRGSRG